VAFIPSSGGLHEATTTSEAQAPNIDPNPSNDTRVSQFHVTAVTPALRHGLVVVLGLVLAFFALTTLRRRAIQRR
jgi:hypothetical protein